MFHIIRIFFFTAIFPVLTFGQLLPVCGMSGEDQQPLLERLEENRQQRPPSMGISERNSVRYIPIHFHRVGNATGQGRISITKLLDQMCALNQQYDSLDVQFYLSPHPNTAYGLFNSSISADNVFTIQTNSSLMNQRRHNRAVNVFAVEEPVSGNTPQPGTITQAYYTTNSDWIVMRKSEFSNALNNGVLAHELGHFFSLPHTFLGYESNYFGPGDAGWPRAPVVSPGGNATERVNGSNCNTAGDRICDTPPDYGFISSNCNPYTGGAQDPLGVPVDPSEKNFMGYFESCKYEFTATQRNLIRADIDATRRNYLDNTFTPAATVFSTPVNLLKSPVQNATTPFYDEVLLEWNVVPEADWYLLELDVTPLYATAQAQVLIFSRNVGSCLLTNLSPGRTYYWRVRPFNAVYTCALARQQVFKTPQTSSAPIANNVRSFLIAPNPTVAGQPATLHCSFTETIRGTLRVSDARGRIVWTAPDTTWPVGDHTLSLPEPAEAAGCYFVRLQTEKGVWIAKWMWSTLP